ncbi:MAG: BamA/TamA family outer membrane protein [Deltaproteobacteria bacterium]|nr:BamA/TamA family outer membrane protein [Deltaproteobacteria bacterium]
MSGGILAVGRAWGLTTLLALLQSCVVTRGPSGAPKIVSVELIGTEALDASEIVAGLANHPPRGIIDRADARLDRSALDIDRRRIESFYRSKGWFFATVMKAEVSETEGGVGLRFVVDEGRPVRFARVSIAGAPLGLAGQLEEALGITLGEPAAYAEYESAKSRVSRALEEAGHSRAKITGELRIDRAKSEATVSLSVEAGPVARFEAPEIVAPDAVSARAVSARMLLSEGDRYDPRLVEASRNRFLSMPALGRTRVSQRLGSASDTIIVRAEVTPGDKNEVRLGIGAAASSSGYDLYGRAGYTSYGLLGPLWATTIELRPGHRIVRSGVGGTIIQGKLVLTRDDFLIPLLELELDGSYARSQREIFVSNGAAVAASMSYPSAKLGLSVGLGLRGGWTEFLEISPFVSPELARELGISSPELSFEAMPSLAWDRRDDAVAPHRGAMMRVSAGPGVSARGTYFSMTPEARAYVSAGPLVFAARFLLAAVTGDVPAARRVFGGGADGHRGFVHRRFSPSVAGHPELPIGGTALYLFSAEARIDLFDIYESPFGVAVFGDAGEVAGALSELAARAPHLAAGGGLRYQTPVGALRTDLGFRLNRRGDSEPDPSSTWAFHFAIGEAF